MKFSNGLEIEVGDEVQVDRRYTGTVVVDLDTGDSKPEYPIAQWAYLRRGLLISTHYGALLHYPPDHKDELALVRRAGAPAARRNAVATA